MSKKFYTKTTYPELSVVNTNTGEIVSGIAKTKVSNIDEFIMVFLNHINVISKLEGRYIKVLLYIWKYSSFNSEVAEGNTITNSRVFKEYIRNNGLNISDSAIDNTFSVLCKNNILLKKSRGIYMLNPQYFFKGTLSDRSKLVLQVTT